MKTICFKPIGVLYKVGAWTHYQKMNFNILVLLLSMVAAQSLAPSKSSPWQDEQFMEKFNALPEHRQRRAIVSFRLHFPKIPLNNLWTIK